MKKSVLLFASALMAAAVMTGCSNKKEAETTAASVAETATEAATEAATEPKETALKADMVIAGGDGAGLIAAIQAVKEGTDPSKVIIVEQSDKLASDIASMDNFMNASNTDEQFDQEIEDSQEIYLADVLKAGNNKNDESLAEFVTGSSEAALEWLSEAGIDLEGVSQKDGSSMARSYEMKGEKKLTDTLTENLVKQAEDLKIQIMKNTTVEEILFNEEGGVAGVKVKGADGEQAIDCYALLITDKALLPLLKETPDALAMTGEESAPTGLLVNDCAEVLGSDGASLAGLYAAGAMTDTAVHGEKALAGNQITGMILLGSAAGTEMNIYAADNSK